MLSKIMTILAITGCAAAERHCEGDCQKSWTNPQMAKVMSEKSAYWDECEASGRCGGPSKSTADIPRGVASPCVNGKSNGAFDCSNIEMKSFLDIDELGFTERISDIWGWVDPLDQSEYAIGCGWQNTSFVDVTDPINPLVVATLKDYTGMGSRWCDVKTYKDHAYVVRDSNPGHGVQVFDLTRLREARNVRRATGEVAALDMDTHYREHGSSHNIAINEETGYAFSIGGDTCSGGLHQIDLRDPKNPQFAGCFADDGYTHDTQCVIYDGPDTEHVGKEICFGYNVRALTITDNSNKDDIIMLSREEYLGNEYCHQGWLTTDHSFAIMNDEGDERNYAPLEGKTRTLIWDSETWMLQCKLESTLRRTPPSTTTYTSGIPSPTSCTCPTTAQDCASWI